MSELNDPALGVFPGLEADRSAWGDCGCWTCVEKHVDFSKGIFMPFVVCPECGNKRCPKAMFHENECTDSNAMSQPGSRFADVGWCKNCQDHIAQATFGEVRRAAETMGLAWNGPGRTEEGPKVWRHTNTGIAACENGRSRPMTFAQPSVD